MRSIGASQDGIFAIPKDCSDKHTFRRNWRATSWLRHPRHPYSTDVRTTDHCFDQMAGRLLSGPPGADAAQDTRRHYGASLSVPGGRIPDPEVSEVT